MRKKRNPFEEEKNEDDSRNKLFDPFDADVIVIYPQVNIFYEKHIKHHSSPLSFDIQRSGTLWESSLAGEHSHF